MTSVSTDTIRTLPFPRPIEVDETLPAFMIVQDCTKIPDYPVDLYRLYFVCEVGSTARLTDSTLNLARGDLLALAPGEVVKLSAPGRLCSVAFHHKFFCVHITKSEFFCDGIVFNRANGPPVSHIPENARELLANRFSEIENVVVNPTPLTHARVISALHSILLLAADYKSLDDQSDFVRTRSTHSTLELDRRFQDLLDAHYRLRHDVAFYTNALGVTPAKLNRHLRKIHGRTSSQLIQERLAIEARLALRSNLKSVKQVALELGFRDQLYFSRFFKKHYGTPPSRYLEVSGRNPSKET